MSTFIDTTSYLNGTTLSGQRVKDCEVVFERTLSHRDVVGTAAERHLLDDLAGGPWGY